MQTNIESALITFGATFSGVLFSLFVWSLKERWRNNKTVKALMQEIYNEFELNLGLLRQVPDTLRIIKSGRIPSDFVRLQCSVLNYAVNSGELRYLRNAKKRLIVGIVLYICESFNRFAENSERLALEALRAPDPFKASAERATQYEKYVKLTLDSLNEYLVELKNKK
ncbi:MAG: hypothetical protein HQ577_00930 [Dehalococcoidia bacterium]|nr:hypothetical protein [Dehalococcoidia bacterium]